MQRAFTVCDTFRTAAARCGVLIEALLDVEMNPQTLYRLTKIGLDWYRKNRVLNRQRTSSQKYSRCIWEVVLGRLAMSAADSKTLFDQFLVDGHSPWYDESEVLKEIMLLLEMEYMTTAPSAELDAIGVERMAKEAVAAKASGRNWKKRNELIRKIDDETLAKLDVWFLMHPDWPTGAI